MEIGLGVCTYQSCRCSYHGLNPCFSGNRFGRFTDVNDSGDEIGLNPCFSGNRFGSKKGSEGAMVVYSDVLILVLVEIGLGEGIKSNAINWRFVLILVLVEIGLGVSY